MARVTLYMAAGCHLCERARATLAAENVEFTEVDIGGDAELEERYREWLPVLEIDGERVFVYFIQPEALRRRLSREWR